MAGQHQKRKYTDADYLRVGAETNWRLDSNGMLAVLRALGYDVEFSDIYMSAVNTGHGQASCVPRFCISCQKRPATTDSYCYECYDRKYFSGR